mgnify:CR=1 FL=1
MFLYKILPTTQRPLPLAVDSTTFSTEWRACWEDKNRDMTGLYEMAVPGIEYWEQLLTRSTLPDINMVSLCARLGPSADVSLPMIDNWIKWVHTGGSVDEHLWMLFFNHVRNANYYPTFASPEMAEFVILRDFKNKIVVDIRSWRAQRIDSPLYDVNFHHIPVAPPYPDHLFLKNLRLDKWETYLLWWIENRRSPHEAARVTHIPFDTFKNEERYVWRYLKQNYSEAESATNKH